MAVWLRKGTFAFLSPVVSRLLVSLLLPFSSLSLFSPLVFLLSPLSSPVSLGGSSPLGLVIAKKEEAADHPETQL